MVYNTSINLYSGSSTNVYGEQTLSASTSIKARVVEETKEVLDVNGEKTLSDLVVHVPAEYSGDFIIGKYFQYGNQNYRVVKLKVLKNEVGHVVDVKFYGKKYG